MQIMLFQSNYLRCLCVLSVAWYAGALVHYLKMDKGEHGCKPKDGQGPSGVSELKVGEIVQDDKSCGIFVCQNKEGDALVHYCQKPAPFEMCTTDGVATDVPFPDCCWKCVLYKDCGKSKEPKDSKDQNEPKNSTDTNESKGDTTPQDAGDADTSPAADNTDGDTTESSSATEPESRRKYKHKKF